jgi:hypothetical protein
VAFMVWQTLLAVQRGDFTSVKVAGVFDFLAWMFLAEELLAIEAKVLIIQIVDDGLFKLRELV